jgi:hypothetical protein
MMHRSFGLLVRLFRNRLFEDDSAGPGSGFQTNIYQILGFLLSAGWFIAYFLMPQLLRLSASPASPQTDSTIFTLRMLFTSFSFAIVGFAAVFEWDTLFPDRRDFLILGTFPVSPWQMFAARLVAVGSLLLLLVGAFNIFPIGMMVVLSILVPSLYGLGWKLVIAQLAATTAASAFALLAVAAVQGLFIHVLSPRAFRRLSPAIQMLGMSAMILCALLYPLYSMLVPMWERAHDIWPWLLPPIWFAGVYDLVVPSGTQRFATYGTHGLLMLAGVFLIASVAWISGYARHYRRTLELEDTHTRTRSRLTWPTVFSGSEEERAISAFMFRTLASSNKHRLFLATYLSVGLAIAILFAIAVRSGKLTLSVDGLRAFPFSIAFFVISGFRAVSQFPAELPANWLFRLAEAYWPEAARRAVRKQALVCGLVPALVATLPVEFVICDWRDVVLHGAFQLLTGALLIEAMFWTFDKVPFTCSYFPGRTNLSLLAGIYLYGFTTYSFHLAAIERRIETNAALAGIVFTAGAVLLAYAWQRKPPATQLRFDGEEPLIRTLDLT